MKKVLLMYPPGRIYQRGEDRCQASVDDYAAQSIRACNDLGYAASMLKKKNFSVFLKDYQTERLSNDNLISDFKSFEPDVVFISITNATIFDDIKIANMLKNVNPNLVVILKGAIFFKPEQGLLDQLDLTNIDYLIGGESEFVIAELVESHFTDKSKIEQLRGIVFKKEGKWVQSLFENWETNVDVLAFPDRSLINNSLYISPDNSEPLATINVSRGCPAGCTYCLTPVISGRRIRSRSAENVFEELKDCYHNHKIRNFFFKSDNFTFEQENVLKLCNLINNSELKGNIRWVANSRVKPVSEEVLAAMKSPGGWLVAFGFESVSDDSLKKMQKGATRDDNLKAAKLARKVGLKTLGFYIVGLPWEDKSHLKETEKFIFEAKSDFIEIHIALPYYGTKLYEQAKEYGLINESVLGRDFFHAPTIGTKYLAITEIEKFRKNMLLKYYLRPNYIAKKSFEAIRSPKTILNYATYGMRLIKNNLFN